MFKLPKKFYNNDLIKFNFFMYLNKFKKNSKRNILTLTTIIISFKKIIFKAQDIPFEFITKMKQVHFIEHNNL